MVGEASGAGKESSNHEASSHAIRKEGHHIIDLVHRVETAIGGKTVHQAMSMDGRSDPRDHLLRGCAEIHHVDDFSQSNRYSSVRLLTGIAAASMRT
jgi:hypothetical protein